MWKAVDFVESFDKTVKMMKDNLPKELMIYVTIYARDISDKSAWHPDGETELRVIEKSTAYDRLSHNQMVTEIQIEE